MLPKKIVITPLIAQSSKFLTDPKANLHLNVGGKVFAVHKEKLTGCHFVLENCRGNQKLYFIEQPFHLETVEKFLSHFYGFQITIETKKTLMHFLNVIEFFEAEDLQIQLQSILISDMQIHDFFFLLEIAYSHNLKKLFEAGLQILQTEDFEQINYNRFDLMQCNFKLFQIVLAKHLDLKSRHKIQGQPFENIEETIQLYCQRYKYNKETQQKLLTKYGSRNGKNPEDSKANVKTSTLKESGRREFRITQDESSEGREEKEVSPESNLISSAKLRKKKARMSECKEDQGIHEKQTKFGFESLRNWRQSVPDTIPEQSPFENTGNRKKIKDSVRTSEFKLKSSSAMKNFTQQAEKQIQAQDNCLMEVFQDEEDIESIAGKISRLLGQYQVAFQQHENKFSAIKNNAKSMISEAWKSKNDSSPFQRLNVKKLVQSKEATGSPESSSYIRNPGL